MNYYARDRERFPGLGKLLLEEAPAVLVVALLVAAVYVYSRASAADATVSADELDSVLLIAAAPNDGGDIVAQIITIADVSDSTAGLESVSPSLTVSVRGTSYTTLQFAYPFGGGAGVASALADAEGTDPLPYVVIKAEELASLVDAAGGVDVRLPADVKVSDGKQVHQLPKGVNTLTSVDLAALLMRAPYLMSSDRSQFDDELGGALVQALTAAPDGLAADAADGRIRTNLDADALDALDKILAGTAF